MLDTGRRISRVEELAISSGSFRRAGHRCETDRTVGVGTAYFLTLAAILGDSDGGDVIVGTAIAGGVLAAGMGAAAGAGIDALITHRQVIYRKTTSENSVSVSPVFGRGRRGAAITVTF